MRINSRIMADNIKANMAKQSALMMESQIKIATGKKLNKLSDDPSGAEKVLDYRTTISSIEQYQENITDAKTRIEYTETILGQVSDMILDAQEIASEGELDDKEALALQINNIREQAIGLGNSKYSGNYIFAGHLSDSLAFDKTSGAYMGDNGSNNIIIGEGIQITLNADGSSIFTESGDNLFDVLEDLETALMANDEDAIKATLDPLVRFDDQLDVVRSEFAGVYNRLEATSEHWTSFSNSVEGMRSKIEDADVTEAALDLQLQQTSYQVLLQVAAQIIQPTLVDFL